MIPCKPILQKLKLTFLFFLSFTALKTLGQDGKAIFQSKCASCHNIFKPTTGPALGGVLESEYYGGDIKKIATWVHNVNKMVNSDPHYSALKQQFGSVMTQFDEATLPEKDIAAIFGY